MDSKNLKRKIKLKIPKEDVDPVFKRNYQKIRQNAKITGFRPGKVPLDVLKRSAYYGNVWEETLQELISEFYPKILKEKEILPAGNPKLLHAHLKENHPASFELEVEAHPQVKLKKYLGLQIKKHSTAVTPKQINQELENLRKYAGTVQNAEKEETLQKNFLGDFKMEAEYKSGKKCQFMCSDSALLFIGHSPIAPGFENRLIGIKRGESREFAFSFPSDYEESRLSGKTLSFKMHLKNIKKEILPELNDEFAKKFKMQTITELKETIQKELERENEQKTKELLRDSIITELINKNPIPLPESFIEEEKTEILRREKDRLKMYKLPEKEIEKVLAKQEKDIEKSAKHNIHAHYLLKALIEELQIKVSNEEVELILKKYSSANSKNLNQDSKENTRQNIIWRLSVNKALDSLLEKAEILSNGDVSPPAEKIRKPYRSGLNFLGASLLLKNRIFKPGRRQ